MSKNKSSFADQAFYQTKKVKSISPVDVWLKFVYQLISRWSDCLSDRFLKIYSRRHSLYVSRILIMALEMRPMMVVRAARLSTNSRTLNFFFNLAGAIYLFIGYTKKEITFKIIRFNDPESIIEPLLGHGGLNCRIGGAVFPMLLVWNNAIMWAGVRWLLGLC